MAAPRGPTRRLRGVYIFINILHIIYTRGFQLSVDRKGIQTLNPSGLKNRTGFTNFSRVGLRSHTVLLIAGHVAQGERLDRDRSAPIQWTRSPQITDQARALLIEL